MGKLNIIKFNDDNHPEKIYANGKYIGDLSNIECILENIIDICNENKYEGIESKSIWICDDFEECEEEIVDTIFDWFWDVQQMSKEEIELVLDENWEELYKLIS